MPNLYVIESPTKANALAAGRGRRHAAICVTTGLLHALSRDELAGYLLTSWAMYSVAPP